MTATDLDQIGNDFGSIELPSLAERAYREVKARIIDCRFTPGKLVIAHRLAPALEMSRTPVHEALKALCQEGFLKVIPKVGYVVTEVSAQDMEEILDLRMLLEPWAASLAAEKSSPEGLKALGHWAKKEISSLKNPSRRTLPSPGDWIRLNREFHLQVAELSGNKQLASTISALLDKSERIYFYYRSSPTDDAQKAHSKVVRAIQSRDAAEAKRTMKAHIEDVKSATLAGLRTSL